VDSQGALPRADSHADTNSASMGSWGATLLIVVPLAVILSFNFFYGTFGGVRLFGFDYIRGADTTEQLKAQAEEEFGPSWPGSRIEIRDATAKERADLAAGDALVISREWLGIQEVRGWVDLDSCVSSVTGASHYCMDTDESHYGPAKVIQWVIAVLLPCLALALVLNWALRRRAARRVAA
jgi:hypothetical protein